MYMYVYVYEYIYIYIYGPIVHSYTDDLLLKILMLYYFKS